GPGDGSPDRARPRDAQGADDSRRTRGGLPAAGRDAGAQGLLGRRRPAGGQRGAGDTGFGTGSVDPSGCERGVVTPASIGDGTSKVSFITAIPVGLRGPGLCSTGVALQFE